MGNKDVLEFINRFVCYTGKEHADAVQHLFRSGYCYYFALILKEAFGRGRVCLAAPYGHIVWEDLDGTAYDVEGICTTDYEFLIPVEELESGLEDFMHVPGRNGFCDAKQVETLMKKYRAIEEMHLD